MIKENIIERAIETFGHMAQKLKAIEEISELQLELITHINKGMKEDTNRKVASEVADVYIILRSIVKIYKIENEVEEEIVSKIKRLEGYIENYNNLHSMPL